MNRRTSLRISSLLAIAAMSSCIPVAEEQPMAVDTLVGKWVDSSQDDQFIEEWQEAEDGLSGKGYVMSEQDTVFIEYLELREVNGILTYFAEVSDHGPDQSVPFGLKEKNSNSMIFENTGHSFPQRIIYQLENDTVLNVFIEGVENGSFRRRALSYLKRQSN